MAEPARGIAVLIPAYNPDEKLLALLPALKARFARIVLVDDGSTEGRDVIQKAAPLVEKVLVHPRNRGKGAALKTGFAYLDDGRTDVITADADGQHTPEDVARVAEGDGPVAAAEEGSADVEEEVVGGGGSRGGGGAVGADTLGDTAEVEGHAGTGKAAGAGASFDGGEVEEDGGGRGGGIAAGKSVGRHQGGDEGVERAARHSGDFQREAERCIERFSRFNPL